VTETACEDGFETSDVSAIRRGPAAGWYPTQDVTNVRHMKAKKKDGTPFFMTFIVFTSGL
jgi:hypothetical protein